MRKLVPLPLQQRIIRTRKMVAGKTVDEFEAELKAANIEVIHADSLSADDDIMKQIVDDNVGMDVDVNPGKQR